MRGSVAKAPAFSVSGLDSGGTDKNPGRHNAPKAPEYTLEQFQAAYDLSPSDALDLFTHFGRIASFVYRSTSSG
jgi:hypothetical protein